jgi:hypothetical protein
LREHRFILPGVCAPPPRFSIGSIQIFGEIRRAIRADANSPCLWVKGWLTSVSRYQFSWLWEFIMNLFLRLSDVEESTQHFLWESFIPLAGLSVLEGPPGVMKSTILCDLAARVTTGAPMPCSGDSEPKEPGGVLIFAGEDNPSRIRALCKAAGADLDRIQVCGRIGLLDVLDRIESTVQELGVKLIIIDPLSDYLPGLVTDKNTRHCLAPLRKLAETYNLAIVMVRHLAKGQRSAVNAGLGSVSIGGVARSVLLAAKHPDDPGKSVLAITKSNVAAPKSISYGLQPDNLGAMTVNWSSQVGITADELLKSIDPVEQTAMEEAIDFLFGILKDGPQRSNDVIAHAKASGISWSTCKRAQRRMGMKHRKMGSGLNQVWIMTLPTFETESVRAAREREWDTLTDDLIHGSPLDGLAKPPVELSEDGSVLDAESADRGQPPGDQDEVSGSDPEN